jgi:hypothetical protein
MTEEKDHPMVTAPLPKCPLPGQLHRTGIGQRGPGIWFFECESDNHALDIRARTREELVETVQRLAAPIAPEAVAVLREIDNDTGGSLRFERAVHDWLRAGCPGLPREAK